MAHDPKYHEAVARALSVALLGDDLDWKAHMTIGRRFLEEMDRMSKEQQVYDELVKYVVPEEAAYAAGKLVTMFCR